MESLVTKAFNLAGLEAGDEIISRSAFFLNEVWNTRQKLNLIGAKSIEELVYKHFLDSLYLLKYYDLKESNLLDLGTGAGFPGVPIKLFCEKISLYLLDSSRRKINFLKYTLNTTGAKEVFYLQGRAESFGNDLKYRENFYAVCSRAVAGLDLLAEWGLPLIRHGGILIAYKGPKGEEELSNAAEMIRICGGEKEKSIKYELPGGEKRWIYVFRKVLPTPPEYPRQKS